MRTVAPKTMTNPNQEQFSTQYATDYVFIPVIKGHIHVYVHLKSLAWPVVARNAECDGLK